MTETKKFNNKWLIALSVLVLVAIVVVVIISCLPKDTKKVISRTNEFTTNVFLTDDNITSSYLEFQEMVKNDPAIKETFGKESDSVLVLSVAMNKVLSFYNDQLIFAKDNKTFQNNYNPVVKNLNKAAKAQEVFEAVVTKVKATLKDEINSTFIKGAWEEFRAAFMDYVDGIAAAVKALDKIYTACIAKGVLVNNLNEFTREVACAYLNQIADVDLSKSANYIDYFYFFTNYFDKEEDGNILVEYTFSSSLQDKYLDMMEVVGSYKNLISGMVKSINATGVTYSIDKFADEYAILVDFVEGGLVA